jgi:hypothetical protein
MLNFGFFKFCHMAGSQWFKLTVNLLSDDDDDDDDTHATPLQAITTLRLHKHRQ